MCPLLAAAGNIINRFAKSTSVVVFSVRAVLFQVDVTTLSEPAILALTLPLPALDIHITMTLVVAVAGTALQGAVLAVVAVSAEASPVGALSMKMTSGVTLSSGAHVA